ncbi:hypothetical protein ACWCPD_25750 [Streptomyces sp. NPDC001935]
MPRRVPARDRRAAEDARQQHRDTEHGGLIPHGEEIARVPGSTPEPDGRYVSTGALLGMLAALAVAEFIARTLGK